ncbi:acyl-CoA dehydrogenase [Streptomyces sp. 21So2-11]|uniref:acyl-CoA dehydrogenase n=1 Tax=Streptomyces sp. 21So2-11 TaxID=3144408 RepID=UPI003219DBC7
MTSLLPSDSTSAALAKIVFGGQLDLHEPWRQLFSTEPFRVRDGLTPQERTGLSYERLRLVNNALDNPERFVADVESLTALHEWAAPADAGMAIVASIHYNLFLGSLLDHNGHGQRDLRDFTELRRTGTFLCMEVGDDNEAARVGTTATYDRVRRGFILNTPTPAASKFLANTSSTGGPKTGIVAARLIAEEQDQGVFLFLTPLSDGTGQPLPGVEISHLPETISSVDHRLTSFDHVPLPHDALLQSGHGRLSPEGVFTSSISSPRQRFLPSLSRMTTGKLCMSAYSLGVTRHAVALAVHHAHTQHTVGVADQDSVPLFAHRSHHAPLIDAIVTTYAATLLHRTAVRRWSRATSLDREDARHLVTVTKGWIILRSRDVMAACGERPDHALAFQLAANGGTITADDDNLATWVKAAGETLLGHFTPEPVGTRASNEHDITDTFFLHGLLADIERIWHQRATTRLHRAKPGTVFERWNAAVTPALDLVDAHAYRRASQALLTGAANAIDPDAQHLLQLMHRHFALRRVAAHSGDLLAEGHLTADQVRQLPDAAEAIVTALEPHAMALIQGFALSEAVLLDHPIDHPGG